MQKRRKKHAREKERKKDRKKEAIKPKRGADRNQRRRQRKREGRKEEGEIDMDVLPSTGDDGDLPGEETGGVGGRGREVVDKDSDAVGSDRRHVCCYV